MKENSGEPSGGTSAFLLHGWDDGKVYLFSPEFGERCVSDEPELLRRLTEICVEYFDKSNNPER